MDARAGGVEIKRGVGGDLHDVSRAQAGMGVGHGDKVVIANRQVQPGLVTKMLDSDDPALGALLPFYF